MPHTVADTTTQMGKLSWKVGLESKEDEEEKKQQEEEQARRSSLTLDDQEDELWLQALLSDDEGTAGDILQEADPRELERLLNGRFVFRKRIPRQRNGFNLRRLDSLRVAQPLFIAAVSSSRSVLSLLLSYGVDVLQEDEKGNNVVHILILIAFLEPALEDVIVGTYQYLVGELELDQTRRLLAASNRSDLRLKPVEYATHLSVYRMTEAIFKTDSVYYTQEDIDSIYTVEWYDVTDYENLGRGYRRLMSPLYFLLMLDEKHVTDKAINDVVGSQFVQNWVQLKMKSVMPIVTVWFFIRVLFIVSFLLFDYFPIDWSSFVVPSPPPVGENATVTADNISTTTTTSSPVTSSTQVAWLNSTATLANSSLPRLLPCKEASGIYINFYLVIFVIYYVFIHALIVVLFDIWEYFYLFCKGYYKFIKTPTCWKEPFVSYGFYRLAQFLQAFFILCNQMSISFEFAYGSGLPPTLLNLLHIAITMSLVWSILFFAQLMPWIGHFVVAVQSMLMKLFQFLVVFCAFTLPFVGTFQRLLNDTKVIGECPEEFSSFLESFYTIFMAMVNMVDFRQFKPFDTYSVYPLHFIYVFLTAILLINFLIALFSTSFRMIDDHKVLVQTIQRLSVISLIEARMMTGLFPCLYRWLNRRSFPVDKDGRCAVPCVVVCKHLQEKYQVRKERPRTVRSRQGFVSYMVK